MVLVVVVEKVGGRYSVVVGRATTDVLRSVELDVPGVTMAMISAVLDVMGRREELELLLILLRIDSSALVDCEDVAETVRLAVVLVLVGVLVEADAIDLDNVLECFVPTRVMLEDCIVAAEALLEVREVEEEADVRSRSPEADVSGCREDEEKDEAVVWIPTASFELDGAREREMDVEDDTLVSSSLLPVLKKDVVLNLNRPVLVVGASLEVVCCRVEEEASAVTVRSLELEMERVLDAERLEECVLDEEETLVSARSEVVRLRAPADEVGLCRPIASREVEGVLILLEVAVELVVLDGEDSSDDVVDPSVNKEE